MDIYKKYDIDNYVREAVNAIDRLNALCVEAAGWPSASTARRPISPVPSTHHLRAFIEELVRESDSCHPHVYTLACARFFIHNPRLLVHEALRTNFGADPVALVDTFRYYSVIHHAAEPVHVSYESIAHLFPSNQMGAANPWTIE